MRHIPMGKVVRFARSRALSKTVDPLNEKIMAMQQACQAAKHQDPSFWWLTRKMIHCPCGWAHNRIIYAEANIMAELTNPKVHCNYWLPWDDPRKFHGSKCVKPKQQIIVQPLRSV